MRVLAVTGSARKGGNTEVLVEGIARGAREGGAEVEMIRLHDLDLKFCQGCEACVTRRPWRGCVQKDDMPKVHEALVRSDALIIGTPIYFFGPSAQTKVFLDRWLALTKSDADGGRHALRGKRLVIAMVYGDDDPVRAGAINALGTIRDAAGYMGMHLVDVVHGSAGDRGDAAKNKQLMTQAAEAGRKLCR